MASINSICEDIVKKVINSKLDYKLNQTPYSIHFSIRKKFSRNDHENYLQPSVKVLEEETKNGQLLQEHLQLRNQFAQLYSSYQSELERNANFESEVHAAHESKDTLKKDTDKEIKKLVQENKAILEKYENKCIEVKQLKSDVEELSKDKNSLSVALKSSRKEIKDQNKVFENKIELFEKKVFELNEFKVKKLAEDREEKLRQRKELKKLKKKNEKNEKLDVSDHNLMIKEEIKAKENGFHENVEEEDFDLKNNNENSLFQCSFCERKFSEFARLIDHIKTGHRLDPCNSKKASENNSNVTSASNINEESTELTLDVAKLILDEALRKQFEKFRWSINQ